MCIAGLTHRQLGTLTKLGEKRVLEITGAYGARPTLKELKLIADVVDISFDGLLSLIDVQDSAQVC